MVEFMLVEVQNVVVLAVELCAVRVGEDDGVDALLRGNCAHAEDGQQGALR